jgi:tetratricopeptide (TPR) repeat protein
VAAAEGNPLYVEQITSMLVETGTLRREGDRWITTMASEDLAIPPTVEALVAARLDALGNEERAVIEPASVVGLTFPDEAVVSLVEPDVRPTVPDRLGTLTARQFVRPTEDEDVHRFGHAVIKDTAYGSLLKRTRASLHERFVEWAEPVNRERGRETEFEEILGYHLEQAYRYRTELGPLDEATRDLGRRAAIKLAGAGRRALGRGDMHAAASLLDRAVALLPERDRFRVELLPELAEAQVEIGEFELTAASTDAAEAEASAIADPRLLARARVSRVFNSIWTPQVVVEGDPIAIVESLRETLASHGDEAGLARAWRVLAQLQSSAGRYDEAAAACEQIIEHASRAGDMRLRALGVAGYSSMAVMSSIPVPELIERCEGLLPMVLGNRKSEAWISQELAQLYAMRGEFGRARELYRRCQAMFADLGPSVSAMTTSIRAARVELLAGDLEAAEAELRRDDAELESIGEQYYRSWITGYLARVLWARGAVDEAERYCSIASDLVEDDDVDGGIQWRSIRAKVLASRGDAEEARAMSDDAVALSVESTDLILRADVLVDRSETMRLLGETSLVAPPLEEALRLYETKGDLVSSARTQRALDEADQAEAT